MSKQRALAAVSFLFGLFAIPVLVFTGGSLIAAALFSLVAIAAGLAALRGECRAARAVAIAGLVLGVASLWYTITGWAVSLDIARSLESLF